MPVLVAFIIATIVAIFQNKEVKLEKKIEIFTRGEGNSDVMLMVMIFILQTDLDIMVNIINNTT